MMRIAWLGHTGFRLDTDGGRKVLIDPWLENPKATEAVQDLASEADIILLSHGHGDHMGSLLRVAEKTGAVIVCIHEIAVFLQRRGIKNEIIGMNKGGTVHPKGVSVTMVHADHSSMIQDGNVLIPGGECVGFVVGLAADGSYPVYHAGDTGVFGDMALIRDLYHPRLTLLPIGDRYTMGPREAALAVKFLDPERVIPMHYGTFPVLTGTVEAFRDVLDPAYRGRVTPIAVGDPVFLP